MRIAFADLQFCWPPNGGADVDLYHVAVGLQMRGHTVRVFVAHEAGSSERGLVEEIRLPFPVEVLPFTRKTLAPSKLGPAFRAAIDAWRPHVVFAQHGLALKPYLLAALGHHKLVSRYYAHELACARDSARFKDKRPCPNDFFRTPDHCRRCALEFQAHDLKRWDFRSWTADYLAARAYEPAYHDFAIATLRKVDVMLVYNEAIRSHLDGYHKDVRLMPSGVPPASFKVAAQTVKQPEDTKIIFMAGRSESPLKGLDTLLAAGRMLAKTRDDFEIHATHFDQTLSEGWFKAVGWLAHEEAVALYEKADICVVPSVWEEPFGIVALEAMAAARPVCASRVGGLQEIVLDGETGCLFERGDAADLARILTRLLDDHALRAQMGKAGRRRVAETYDWDVIMERNYEPLLAELAKGG